MRVLLAAAFILMAAPTALAADFPREPGIIEDMEEVVPVRKVRRTVAVEYECIACPGHRLPLGGLRKPTVAHVPLGGLRSACPPARRVTREVVLRVKG